MKEIILFALIFVYLYLGDRAIYYFKVNVMGVRAEIYGDTINYIGQRAIKAAIFGWAAIPAAFIHKNFIAGR